MKKRMRLYEFAEYIKQNPPARIIYLSDNQPDYNALGPFYGGLWQELKFDRITIFPHQPASLMLHMDSAPCKAVFNAVEYVYVDTETSVLGTLVSVYCKTVVETGGVLAHGEREHVLIAQGD